MADWAVRVPASSANLGPGFDVLGMALTLHAEFRVSDHDRGGRLVDEHHPASVAFRQLGGTGALWVRSPIPVGRGLGFSGAMRVGGATAAVVQRHGAAALDDSRQRASIQAVTSELEGHADNVGASLHGGVIIAAGTTVTPVPLGFDPAIVVWIPDVTTSTDQSRARLPETVSRTDAVFNLGRVAMLVAAFATGDVALFREATADRLHQPVRLEQVPQSATAMQIGLEAGAWATWLSGSGPTVAMMCASERAGEIASALPAAGHTKLLRIDHQGARVTT